MQVEHQVTNNQGIDVTSCSWDKMIETPIMVK